MWLGLLLEGVDQLLQLLDVLAEVSHCSCFSVGALNSTVLWGEQQRGRVPHDEMCDGSCWAHLLLKLFIIKWVKHCLASCIVTRTSVGPRVTCQIQPFKILKDMLFDSNTSHSSSLPSAGSFSEVPKG